MAVDPHYANVSLLLHCDGADGSTTFLDSSPRPKVVTAHGDAAITTADGRFGGSCLALSGGHLLVASDADYAFGGGEFTVEMWVKTASNNGIALIEQPLEEDVGWYMTLGRGRVQWRDDYGNYLEGSPVVNGGQWTHIAVTRKAGLLYSFVNGQPDTVEYGDTDYTHVSMLRIGSSDPDRVMHFVGLIDELRITKGVARYTGEFSVPTEPFGDGNSLEAITAIAEAPSPLGGACVLAQRHIEVITATSAAASPLGRAAAVGFHDFTGQLGDPTTLFVMDLVTPTGSVRVPISSWQATLQTGSSNYVQCVIPACATWTEAINAAAEFVIYRRAVLPSGKAIEYEMARAPAGQTQFDRGPRRHTCTLSGYSDAFADSADPPPAAYDRALTGVRSISSGKSYRVRCAVDWLLRPGHRAFVSGAPFVVKFINYYAPSEWDSYMDVGG